MSTSSDGLSFPLFAVLSNDKVKSSGGGWCSGNLCSPTGECGPRESSCCMPTSATGQAPPVETDNASLQRAIRSLQLRLYPLKQRAPVAALHPWWMSYNLGPISCRIRPRTHRQYQTFRVHHFYISIVRTNLHSHHTICLSSVPHFHFRHHHRLPWNWFHLFTTSIPKGHSSSLKLCQLLQERCLHDSLYIVWCFHKRTPQLAGGSSCQSFLFSFILETPNECCHSFLRYTGGGNKTEGDPSRKGFTKNLTKED